MNDFKSKNKVLMCDKTCAYLRVIGKRRKRGENEVNQRNRLMNEKCKN